MDPILRAFMFHSWMEDYADEYKLLENQGYLIASFSNPEGVKRAMGKGSETHMSSDAEFEETSRKVMEDLRKLDDQTPKRKRRKLIG